MGFKKSKKNLSIKHKIIGGFSLLVLLSSIIIGFYAYFTAKKNIENTVGSTALNIVKSMIINIDADKFNKLNSKEDMDSEYYKELQSHLDNIRKSTGLQFLYTMKETSANKYIYVVDGRPSEDKDFSALGEEEESISPSLARCFTGTPGYTFNSDEWGNQISAYYPIKDSSGKVVGILGADFDASIMVNQLNKFKVNISIIIILIIIIGIIISGFLSNFIVRSLEKLKNSAELIKNGDLTVEFNKFSNDEVGQLAGSFREMVNNLLILTNEIKNNTTDVTSEIDNMYKSINETSNASEEITQVISEIAAGSFEQTQSIKVVSLSMNEAIKQVKTSVEHAKLVSNASDTSISSTSRALEIFKTSIEKVNMVNNTIEHAADIIKILGDKSKEITSFSETISQITNQTNLLSLNAAIEAARAGEQGKGFAVVANEIKALAEQSNIASSQISEIANSMQNETSAAIKTIQAGVTQAIEGVASVNQVDSYLSDLQKTSSDTNIRIKEIIEAINSIEESCIHTVNKIQNLDDISNSFSVVSQQAAASTEEQAAIMLQIKGNVSNIKAMTENLNTAINKFKIE